MAADGFKDSPEELLNEKFGAEKNDNENKMSIVDKIVSMQLSNGSCTLSATTGPTEAVKLKPTPAPACVSRNTPPVALAVVPEPEPVSAAAAYSPESKATISIKKADIPVYLHNSEFYQSLQDGEEEETILVPSDCLKMDDIVSNNRDLKSLLMTLRFWVGSCICDPIRKYLAIHPPEATEDEIAEFYPGFPVLTYLTSLSRAKDPMKLALESGDAEMVQYVLQRGHQWPMKTACDLIVKTEKVELLKIALQAGCKVTKRTAEIAAAQGHLNCLRFLRENNAVFSKAVSGAAARGGHLDCLMYAHQQGAPLESTFFMDAVANNNFNMLQYLHENSCPWDEKACRLAAASGRMECLQYMHENGCVLDSELCYFAVENAQIPIVLYLLRNGCPPSDNIWNFTGDAFQQILQCFLDVGLAWSATPLAMLSVIESGYMEGLQLLVESGCPWHPTTTSHIASYDRLDMLKYVHKKGCPWDAYTCISSNCIEFLTYAHTHGALIPVDSCTKILEPYSNNPKVVSVECFKYIHLRGGCSLQPNFTFCAARDGNLELLKYLHEQGCAWSPQLASTAASKGHADCLEYILSHGGEFSSHVLAIAEHGQIEACIAIARKYRKLVL